MFINYAHRGASEYAPENTFAAFYMGQFMGANGIETDVQKTADGNLVLFHDDTMERITGLQGSIGDYTYNELLQMDFGVHKGSEFKNEPIVLLRDFLKYFGGKPLSFAIEIKTDGIEREVLSAIEDYHCKEKVIVTSFVLQHLVNVRDFDEGIILGFLTYESGKKLIDDMLVKGIMQY